MFGFRGKESALSPKGKEDGETEVKTSNYLEG